MFYILLDENYDLVITKKDTLRRGDSLSKKVIYLIPSEMEEIDPQTATFYLSYIRPDGSADIMILERMEEMYQENYFQFTFPLSSKITKYPGEVITWMQIYDGESGSPKVVKSSECVLRILDSRDMDDYMPDTLMTAFHQLKSSTDDRFTAVCTDVGQNSDAIASNADAIRQNSSAIQSNAEAVQANAQAISGLYTLVAEKADGLVFDAATLTVQLTSGGEPVGSPVKCYAEVGKTIDSVSLTTGGELVVFFSDGTFTNVGKVVGEDGKVYVPHLVNSVLSFTVEDRAGKIPDPIDLDVSDNWSDIGGDIDDIEGEGNTTPYYMDEL